MKWTEEQSQAIQLKNRRLLVSAAAGSGKTAVLTERIVRRISNCDDPVDIDSLLVMTFTRAAASEMRERIRKRLEEELNTASGQGGNPAAISRLRRQTVLLDGAKITTIDSFCLSLIREHVDETTLDPSFRVGGEEELRLMQCDVMEALLEEQYAGKEEGFLRFADGFSRGKTDLGLSELLLSVCRFAESTAWPDDWLDRCEQEADQSAKEGESIEHTSWMQYLLKELREEAADLLEKAEQALALCREENGPSGYEAAIASEAALLRQLSNAEQYADVRRILNAFREWQRIGTNPKMVDKEKAKQAKTLRDFWKGEMQKLLRSYLPEDDAGTASDLLQEADTIRTVVAMARAFRAAYTEKKRERNLLDFSDLEHIALSLLWKKTEEGYKKTELAERVAASFQEIYVDEYQDSNGVQEALLRAMDRGSMFLVGDIKQSIYAFRQAKPALFAEKYRCYRKHTKAAPVEDGTDTRIDLRKNFRSRREVLDTANRVFVQLMNERVGGIRYDEDAALYPGASYPEPQEEKTESGGRETEGSPYRTELLLTEISAYDAEEKQAETEAHLMAERIRSLVDPSGETKVYDASLGQLRPAEFRDIVILLRSAQGQAEAMVEVLMQEGIPAVAEQRTGYFNALEVRTVLSLLSAIDNPMQDIPLAAVLHSPMGSLSAEELAALLSEAQESEQTSDPGPGKKQVLSLYERLRSVSQSPRYPEAAAKLRRTFSFLEEAAVRASYLSLPALIRELLETSGYDLYVSALPGGEVRKANLDMLMVKAGDYERTGYRGLYDFVRYIELLKKYDTDYGEAETGLEAGNAVRIMTIHKSKGLEFPIVFLAGIGRRFQLRDTQAGIIMDEKMGLAADIVDLGLRTRGSGLKKNAIARYLRTEALGEELRVLYVAMTRAKEKLLLTAAVSDSEQAETAVGEMRGRPNGADLRAAGCILDWVLTAMAGDPGHCGISLRILSPACDDTGQNGKGTDSNEMREALLALIRGKKAEQEGDMDLFRFLTQPYPYEEDVSLYVKRSVSELKYLGEREEDQESGSFLEPSAESETERHKPGGTAAEGETAAERGTVYHRVMEKLDYGIIEGASNPTAAVRTILDTLEEQGDLLPEERALLDEEELKTLLVSPLGLRMAAAARRGELHREAQFVMALPANEIEAERRSEEPVLVQGVMDAWFSEGDRMIVVDYKTDRVRCEEVLSERYRKQLSYYSRALEMMEGRKVQERILWSFSLGRQISL